MGLSSFNETDRFYWHGYDYGERRISLDDRGRTSPIDPQGDWFSEPLADAAERFSARKAHRRLPEKVRPPSSQQALRTNLRQIPWHLLTEAERRELEPEIDALTARLRSNLGTVEKRGRRAVFPPRSPTYSAPEIERTPDPRVQNPTSAADMPRLYELIDRHAPPAED